MSDLRKRKPSPKPDPDSLSKRTYIPEQQTMDRKDNGKPTVKRVAGAVCGKKAKTCMKWSITVAALLALGHQIPQDIIDEGYTNAHTASRTELWNELQSMYNISEHQRYEIERLKRQNANQKALIKANQGSTVIGSISKGIKGFFSN
jgi:hypothetical protein